MIIAVDHFHFPGAPELSSSLSVFSLHLFWEIIFGDKYYLRFTAIIQDNLISRHLQLRTGGF